MRALKHATWRGRDGFISSGYVGYESGVRIGRTSIMSLVLVPAHGPCVTHPPPTRCVPQEPQEASTQSSLSN